MNKRLNVKIIIYNYINSLLFVTIGSFATLKPFIHTATESQIIICILFSVFSSVQYYYCVAKKSSSKDMVRFSVINIILFAFFTIINFIIYNFLKPYLPIAELNDAYGIWIMFLECLYLILSHILKIVIFIICIFIHKKNDKQK